MKGDRQLAPKPTEPSRSGASKQPLRLACFVQGWHTPSSRFRILQYLPKLQAQGIEADVFVTAPGPEGWTSRWFPGPVYKLVRRASQLGVYLPRRWLQLRSIPLDRYDAVFLQKRLTPGKMRPVLERALAARNPRIVFDVDDAIFVGGADGKAEDGFRSICRLSHTVIAGNRFLADHVPGDVSTRILSTTVCEERFRPLDECDPDRPVCIGWTGSGSNLHYLVKLLPALKRLGDRGARFRVICNRYPTRELAGIPGFEFVQWTESSEVSDLQRADIGIMPLENNLWTRGKCAFKLIQYMAIGIPSVVSPVGANLEVLEHGRTGYFADSSHDWFTYLERLVEEPALRQRLGRQARERFDERYRLSGNALELGRVIREAASS